MVAVIEGSIKLDGNQGADPVDDSKQTHQKRDLFTVLFFLLLDAMGFRQDTALVMSKMLSKNADIQTVLNLRNGKIHFEVLPDDIDKNMSVKRLYTTDYINAVTHTGATFLANSEEEYLKHLKEVLSKGNTRDDKKADFIHYFMYKNDGQSAKRLADNLIHLTS